MTTLSPEEEKSLIDKYKTLGRAVIANDVDGCRVLYKVFKDMGKTLEENEINALGLQWLMNKKTPYNIEVASFLNDIGFDFHQKIIINQKVERVGTPIPFRMIEDKKDQALLLLLIDKGLVKKDVMDGLGDNLFVETLALGQFELADELHARGLDVNHQNIGGQTPLHATANKALFRATEWLVKNGADPTIEDLQRQRPSEMVPEDVGCNWDVDSLYDVLEQYVDDFRAGRLFVSSDAFDSQVAREKAESEQNENQQTVGEFQDDVKNTLSGLGI